MKIKDFFKCIILDLQTNPLNDSASGISGWFNSLSRGWSESANGTALASLSLTQFLGIAGGLVAVVAIVALHYKYMHRLDDAIEDVANAYSDFSETANELNSLNSELETTQEKIAELQSYDTLSLADEAELEKLHAQNEELERQIQLKEKEVNQKKEKTLDGVKEVLTIHATVDVRNNDLSK